MKLKILPNGCVVEMDEMENGDVKIKLTSKDRIVEEAIINAGEVYEWIKNHIDW